MLSPGAFTAYAALLLLLTFLGSVVYAYRSRRQLDRLEDISNKNFSSIQDLIDNKLSPTIHVHDGRPRVTLTAASLIEEAASEEKPEDRQITFYGAASLSTARENAKQGEDDAAEKYRVALRSAAKAHLRIRRYISFFTPEEMKTRSISVATSYLSWLERQFRHLQEDELYKLVEVVRAPKWGANMARLITKRCVMEIAGNGAACIVIRDPSTAIRIRDFAREAVEGTNPRNPLQVYGLSDPGSMQLLREHIKQTKSAIERIE